MLAVTSSAAEETGATRVSASSSSLVPAGKQDEAWLVDSALFSVIAAAVDEAAAVEATDPLIFVGLRLLQHSERVVRLQPPQVPIVALQTSISSDGNIDERIQNAEAELDELREQLHQVEMAEAMKAMQPLLGRHESEPVTDLKMWVFTDASITIQAAFHGMVARRWVREQLREQSRAPRNQLLSLTGEEHETTEAATAIQAGLRGLTARQWRREAVSSVPGHVGTLVRV